MMNKLDSEQINSLLEVLIDTPYWHGETNADNEALEAIDTWGDVAFNAFQKLTDAFNSTDSAPKMNGSAIEIQKAVRGQIDALRECMPEDEDDLPTIPEVVDEFIRGWGYATLVMIFSQAKHLSTFAPTKREQLGWQWIVDNEDEFARAWIYGVWCVEETGEIVRL